MESFHQKLYRNVSQSISKSLYLYYKPCCVVIMYNCKEYTYQILQRIMICRYIIARLIFKVWVRHLKLSDKCWLWSLVRGWCIDFWGCLCLKYFMFIILTYVVLFATNVYTMLCVHQLFGWCRGVRILNGMFFSKVVHI